MSNMNLTTYREILPKLNSNGRRKLGNNTYAEMRQDGTIEVRLHGHAIATLHEDGTIYVDLCGWPTVTTRNRLSQILAPVNMTVNTRRGVQYLTARHGYDPDTGWQFRSREIPTYGPILAYLGGHGANV